MPKPWFVGMRQLMPGIYVAPDGALNVDSEELCLAMGYVPTPENQRTLEAAVVETFSVESVHRVIHKSE